MRKKVLFLIAVVLLFLIPSLILEAIYGPSYGFLAGEDCWQPDGSGGWVKHGQPSMPPPDEPSVEVPMGVRYIPIFLPGLLLFLFLFTPLSRHIDTPARKEDKEATEGGAPGDDIAADDDSSS
jgi:hypothetical protein